MAFRASKMAVHGYLAVVGSVNHDTFSYVRDLPEPGQTVLATGMRNSLGGKGANQAVAASLLGADVEFVGLVGDDSAGEAARAALDDARVGTGQLGTRVGIVTGTAQIAVDSGGENTVIVMSGANSANQPHDIETSLETLAETRGAGASLILAQGELSVDVVDFVADYSRKVGVRFVLNLAPVISVGAKTLSRSDPLVLNEGEALELVGSSLTSTGAHNSNAAVVAEILSKRYSTAVVVTLGADGVVVADGRQTWCEPSPRPRQIVDSTGAGDAFVGALAFALWRGAKLRDAVRLGVAAGSHAVSLAGTTSSYGDLKTLIQGGGAAVNGLEI